MGQPDPRVACLYPLFFLQLFNSAQKMKSLENVKEHTCQIGIKLC